MANLRSLNNPSNPSPNPLADFLTSISTALGPDHPLTGAFNPSPSPRGPPPSYTAPQPQAESGPAGHSPEEATPPGSRPTSVPPPHHGGAHHGPPPHEDSRDPFDGHFGPGFGRHSSHGHGPGPHHHRGGPHSHPGRGGWGGRGSWGGRGRCGSRGAPNAGGWPLGGGFDMSKLGDFLAQFAPEGGAAFKDKNARADADADFEPEADIFDTATEYVIHVSLPGARKEDVGVNYDADESELRVAGVVYRPGEEGLLKCLAVDGRRVGAFEKRVKLGTRAEPASVDVEGVSARMVEGVLVVRVPKVERWQEVRKVDVE